MKNKLLSKEDFCSAIAGIERFNDFEDSLNDLMRKFCTDGYIFFPEIVGTLINVLEKIFDDKENDWIGYYVWELKCGKKWEPGMITNTDGTEYRLKTAEDLYNLLIGNLKGESSNE